MPLFLGVGARITERLKALGYVRADGKPDVSRWCWDHRYDKTVMYYWIRDQRTPVKGLKRLAADLGVSPHWLLLGAEPAAKKRGRPRKIIAGLLLGTFALAGVPAKAEPLLMGKREPMLDIMSAWRRRRFAPLWLDASAVPSAA